jgi:hypothetical protein
MPPSQRPLPRFVAEPPHELEPYGRWGESLEQRFRTAAEAMETDEQLGAAGEVVWYPERSFGGRVYLPASCETGGGFELFGYVSFVRSGTSPDPGDFVVQVDYTAETAAGNPGWKLDLNDEVIGSWKGPGRAEGDFTLVWGRPLVPGGVFATAELGPDTLDQCALVQSDGFTLVALDAVRGFGDDLYLEVKLWNRNGELLATESLYEAGE